MKIFKGLFDENDKLTDKGAIVLMFLISIIALQVTLISEML